MKMVSSLKGSFANIGSLVGGGYLSRRSSAFLYRVRVCNAFPYKKPLDVYLGKEQLTDSPIEYKGCADLSVPLTVGAKLEFKADGAQAGSFAVTELPTVDSLLLLVIHKADYASTAVAFESHIFASLLNAQIAVIDTYKSDPNGKQGAGESLSIEDHPATVTGQTNVTIRSEPLSYNSVVALEQGYYVVRLSSADGTEVNSAPLVALNKESYVVLRVGVLSPAGTVSYPEELLVYPQFDASRLSGASSRLSMSSMMASTMMALVVAIAAVVA